jgi:uncharacterized protein YktB (UPF0637 family)
MARRKDYTPLRARVIDRARELDLTAYAIAVAAKHGDEWVVSADHVKAYLDGAKDMTSAKLDAVLKVLGLRVS